MPNVPAYVRCGAFSKHRHICFVSGIAFYFFLQSKSSNKYSKFSPNERTNDKNGFFFAKRKNVDFSKAFPKQKRIAQAKSFFFSRQKNEDINRFSPDTSDELKRYFFFLPNKKTNVIANFSKAKESEAFTKPFFSLPLTVACKRRTMRLASMTVLHCVILSYSPTAFAGGETERIAKCPLRAMKDNGLAYLT